MELWVVGRVGRVGRVNDLESLSWEFCGVFDTIDAAISACVTECHFVGPAILNECIPEESTETWPGGFYPSEIEETKEMHNEDS